MTKLVGDKISLRAIELEDLDFLYQVENSTSIWHLSNSQVPFSRYLLEQYILSSQENDAFLPNENDTLYEIFWSKYYQRNLHL